MRLNILEHKSSYSKRVTALVPQRRCPRFDHSYPKLENSLSELHHTSKPLHCVSFIAVLSTAAVMGYLG
jgi:hypothetical protein